MIEYKVEIFVHKHSQKRYTFLTSLKLTSKVLFYGMHDMNLKTAICEHGQRGGISGKSCADKSVETGTHYGPF